MTAGRENIQYPLPSSHLELNTMINISKILSDVNDYLEYFHLIKHLIPKPKCKNASCKIIHWGCYRRSIIIPQGVARKIYCFIKRFFCKVCKKTLSFIPTFLIPFKRYLSITINTAFKKFCTGEKLSNICDSLSLDEDSIVKKWCYPILKNSELILKSTVKFIHQKTSHFNNYIYKIPKNPSLRINLPHLYNLLSLASNLFYPHHLPPPTPYFCAFYFIHSGLSIQVALLNLK